MIGSALLDRGGAALDRPARLAAAVERLPGAWGRTVRQRLEVLAERRGGPTSGTTAL